MVAHTARSPLADTSYFQGLLQDLYSGLVGLPVGDFAESPSDGYTQAVYRDSDKGGNRHLECWLNIGRVLRFEKHAVSYSSTLAITYREQMDDDALSQARIQSSVRQVSEFLAGWAGPEGERIVEMAGTQGPDPIGDGWAGVVFFFTLQLPRSR